MPPLPQQQAAVGNGGGGGGGGGGWGRTQRVSLLLQAQQELQRVHGQVQHDDVHVHGGEGDGGGGGGGELAADLGQRLHVQQSDRLLQQAQQRVLQDSDPHIKFAAQVRVQRASPPPPAGNANTEIAGSALGPAVYIQWGVGQGVPSGPQLKDGKEHEHERMYTAYMKTGSGNVAWMLDEGGDGREGGGGEKGLKSLASAASPSPTTCEDTSRFMQHKDASRSMQQSPQALQGRRHSSPDPVVLRLRPAPDEGGHGRLGEGGGQRRGSEGDVSGNTSSDRLVLNLSQRRRRSPSPDPVVLRHRRVVTGGTLRPPPPLPQNISDGGYVRCYLTSNITLINTPLQAQQSPEHEISQTVMPGLQGEGGTSRLPEVNLQPILPGLQAERGAREAGVGAGAGEGGLDRSIPGAHAPSLYSSPPVPVVSPFLMPLSPTSSTDPQPSPAFQRKDSGGEYFSKSHESREKIFTGALM